MSTTQTERPQGVYALGHTPAEYERLRMQARSWEAATGRLLDQAGLGPGASCLDAGCGPGETMRLMAQRTGPTGRELGIDSDGTTGAAALALLRRTAHRNCRLLIHNLPSRGSWPVGPFYSGYACRSLFHLS